MTDEKTYFSVLETVLKEFSDRMSHYCISTGFMTSEDGKVGYNKIYVNYQIAPAYDENKYLVKLLKRIEKFSFVIEKGLTPNIYAETVNLFKKFGVKLEPTRYNLSYFNPERRRGQSWLI